MKNKNFKKVLVFGFIFLFLGLAVQPINSINILEKEKVESITKTDILESGNDCNCQLIEQNNTVFIKKLFTKLQVYIKIIKLKFGNILKIADICNDMLKIINSNVPFYCNILEKIGNSAYSTMEELIKLSVYFYSKGYYKLAEYLIVVSSFFFYIFFFVAHIGYNLGCW